MKKRDELTDPNSCMSRAKYDEMTFVLLGRDMCAADTIRYWAAKRVLIGKNNRHDQQITEALACATEMERQWLELMGVKTGSQKAEGRLLRERDEAREALNRCYAMFDAQLHGTKPPESVLQLCEAIRAVLAPKPTTPEQGLRDTHHGGQQNEE
jgi:hypothetical protein